MNVKRIGEDDLVQRNEPSRLDLHARKEIADALWGLFCMHSDHVTFSFDEDGLSIRVPFQSPVDLDGPAVISGIVKGFRDYHEFELGRK